MNSTKLYTHLVPNCNQENTKGEFVENGEGVKDYVWQRQKTIFLLKKNIMKKKLKDLHSFEPGQYLLTKTNKGIGSW